MRKNGAMSRKPGLEDNRPITKYIDPRKKHYKFPTLKFQDDDISEEFDEIENKYK